ncbi:MAG: ABC transporter permease, partial [Polyangiaceae bacterium]|nr:ABC transporter permease [Polyangiaceae bacterium]
PDRMPSVLDLPKHVREGTLEGIRRPESKPAERRIQDYSNPLTAPQPLGSAGSANPREQEFKDNALLEEIRKSVERDRQERPIPSQVENGAEPEKGEGVVGEVTPKGGFKSELPEDDPLIDAVLPTSCGSGTSKLPGLAIGRTLAKQLAAKLNDCVQITSPTIGVSYGATGTRPPIAKQFRIQAIFEAGFDQYDSKLVYTDLYEAQAFYEQGDSVTGLELKVDDIGKSKEVKENIDRVLANGIYHTMDWKELNHGLFTALLIQQVVMSIVLALIVVVAAFTVIAALVMLVLEKKKEIAVLKSLGATDAAIQRIFLYQGAAIGLAGTLVGLFLGYLGCRFLAAYRFPLDPKVYFISQLPVNLRWNEFFITSVVAFFICLIATVFPARYAASLRPSEGLRPDG